MLSLKSLVSSIAFLTLGTVAFAETISPPDCPQAPAIIATADYLLAAPAKVGRFWRDGQASDAAYAKIRYGGIAYGQARELIRSLGEREKVPERWLELRLAQASKDDRAKDIADLDIKSLTPQRAAMDLGPSALRAMIRDDGGAWIVSELKRAESGEQAKPTPLPLVRALDGLPEATLHGLGKRAEAAGQFELAYAAYAREPDLADLVAFLDRAPDAFYARSSSNRADFRKQLLRTAVQEAAFLGRFDLAAQPTVVKTIAAESVVIGLFGDLGGLMAQAPETAMLATALNVTGKREIGSAVAKPVLDDIAAKRLDPDKDPDQIVVATIERLDTVLGKELRESVLGSFDIVAAPASDSRTAQTFADEALAREVLAPLITGAATQVEADKIAATRPAAMGMQFDWARWVMIAGTLRKGDAVNDQDRPIAGSLLMAAGGPDQALAMLMSATDWQAGRGLAHNLLIRLDRGCARLLKPEPASLQPIYSFTAD